MKRKFVIFFAIVLVAGGVYGLNRLWSGFRGIPKEFTDARMQGAIIAQNIVNLSNQSAADLQKINELDANGNYAAAITLTTNAIKQSQEIRDQAVELSSEVEAMTRALSDIGSLDARQAALESIANRLALISRLINYSGYLGQLLDSLQAHFSGTARTNVKVHALVEQLNSEVNAINNFNAQAGQAMDRFDKIVEQ
ncbi:MAG: hypothetical protein Q8P49_01405 [Candidatus Liptonbacteria bacterium]|nr:hypothetical protein [Candidatus Liptonbacteria bacterium]